MKAGVTILISNNANFIINNTTRDNEDHFIIIPGSVHPRFIIILNVHVPNDRASRIESQKERQIHNYSQRFQ